MRNRSIIAHIPKVGNRGANTEPASPNSRDSHSGSLTGSTGGMLRQLTSPHARIPRRTLLAFGHQCSKFVSNHSGQVTGNTLWDQKAMSLGFWYRHAAFLRFKVSGLLRRKHGTFTLFASKWQNPAWDVPGCSSKRQTEHILDTAARFGLGCDSTAP